MGTGELVYDDGQVKLYRGDCRDLLPDLGVIAHVCVTDPPYQETSAVWDRWPDGWLAKVAAALPPDASLWCFGTMRLFLGHVDEFEDAGWKYAEDSITELVWDKGRSTGPSNTERLAKSHEIATHWYRGTWGKIHHDWPRVPREHSKDKSAVRRASVAHRGDYGPTSYVDDGLRNPTSVQIVRSPSVRFKGRHLTEKPVAVMLAPARASVPPGGTLLDPFAGSGTSGEVARLLGCRAVLIERDPAACEVITTRLSETLPTAGPAADPGDTTVTALPPTPTADQQLALVEGA